MHHPPDPPLSLLLGAYANGLFPMGHPAHGQHPSHDQVEWFDPERRGVFPLTPDGLRLSRSLRALLRRGTFRITANTAFDRVIRACAAVRPSDDPDHAADATQITTTWITPTIIRWYTALHHAGHAHSVEAWLDTPQGPALVGGLYGVSLRGLFAGESMFSWPKLGGTDASKACLVALHTHLRRRGYRLLDTQFLTPHLASLGAVEVTRRGYHAMLEAALAPDTAEITWNPFEP